VAIDSSVPLPPGVAGFGRFGVLAPPRSLWIHHSLAADAVSFVLQLGPDHLASRDALRRAIPAALEKVRAALAGLPQQDTHATSPSTPPTRVAYRRLLGLLGALKTRPSLKV
jgi:hypothetical protein